MASDIPDTHRVTIGADKGDDYRKFVDDLRRLNVTPHVAQKVKGSAIDSRTTWRVTWGQRFIWNQRRK